MKTLLLFFALLLSNFALSQDYRDELPVVYIKSVASSPFSLSTYHQGIAFLPTERLGAKAPEFRNPIRQVGNYGGMLYLIVKTQQRSLTELSYLRTLRRAANRSETLAKFRQFLSTEFPILEKDEIKEEVLKKIYGHLRPRTLNGKLEALPSVL
ncbi:hypothetical protein [Croceiramulus getboli]|nr:hypothetical protein P8624_01000 [Flavobacteriaceae bacterium YJPT1-3]